MTYIKEWCNAHQKMDECRDRLLMDDYEIEGEMHL